MVKRAETVGSTMDLGDALFSIQLESTADGMENKSRTMLLAPPNGGKTMTALTISELFPRGNFPPAVIPAPEVIDLEDTVVINTEPAGVRVLRAFGLKVDMINLAVCPLPELERATLAAVDYVGELVAAGKKKAVIFDSLSLWVSSIEASYTKFRGDSFTLYRNISYANQSLDAALRKLPCHVVMTAHIKSMAALVKTEATEEQKTIKQTASGITGCQFEMDIPGKSSKFWRASFADIYPVIRKGKVPDAQWVIAPFGAKGIEHKCKFPLDKEEPADLQYILQKMT